MIQPKWATQKRQRAEHGERLLRQRGMDPQEL